MGFGNGSTPEEARENARSYLLRKLSSSIETEIERVSTVHQINKKETGHTSLKSTTTMRAHFDYGQFVQDLGRTHKKGRRHYALTCLDKNSTAQFIFQELSPELKRFDQQHKKLQDFVTAQDMQGFTILYREIKKSFSAVLPKLFQLSSLDSDPRGRSYIARYRSIDIEADQFRSSVRFAILPSQK